MRQVLFSVAVIFMFLTSAVNAIGDTMAITTVPGCEMYPGGVAYPDGLAVDSTRNLYIANTGGSNILRVSSATGAITTVAAGGATYGGLLAPEGVAVDSVGNVYIADTGNNRILEVSVASGFITVAGCGSDSYCPGSYPYALGVVVGKPSGIATDAAGNFYYIAQSSPGASPCISEVAPWNGEIVGSFGCKPGIWPNGAAVDSAGNVYFSDLDGNRVWKAAAGTGALTIVAGDGTEGFSGDGGPATAAELNTATGVAVDTIGNLYIADAGNNRVRRVDGNSGIITTLAGNGTAGFSGDGGSATAAALNRPTGVAADSAGNVFIADYGNSRIRVVSPPLDISSTCTSGNGTITSSLNTVGYGGTVTFTIEPSAGYTLWALTDNGVNVTQAATWNASQGVYTYTIPYVTSNNAVQATFGLGPPPAAPVPALSVPVVTLLMLGLAAIVWRGRKKGQNPRMTSGRTVE